MIVFIGKETERKEESESHRLRSNSERYPSMREKVEIPGKIVVVVIAHDRVEEVDSHVTIASSTWGA